MQSERIMWLQRPATRRLKQWSKNGSNLQPSVMAVVVTESVPNDQHKHRQHDVGRQHHLTALQPLQQATMLQPTLLTHYCLLIPGHHHPMLLTIHHHHLLHQHLKTFVGLLINWTPELSRTSSLLFVSLLVVLFCIILFNHRQSAADEVNYFLCSQVKYMLFMVLFLYFSFNY